MDLNCNLQCLGSFGEIGNNGNPSLELALGLPGEGHTELLTSRKNEKGVLSNPQQRRRDSFRTVNRTKLNDDFWFCVHRMV